MPTVVTCSACGQRFTAQDHLLGQTIPCPACGGAIYSPSPSNTAIQSALSSPANPLGAAKPRRRRSSFKIPNLWTILKVVGGVLAAAVVLAIVIPTVAAFRQGYRRAVTLHQGSDQWSTYHSDRYGFSAELPDNFFERPSRIESRDIASVEVQSKHTNGVYISVDLASAPDVQQWPGRMFKFQSVKGVTRFPASGLVTETESLAGGEQFEWNCAMAWGDSFSLISVFGKDRDKVEAMADKVLQSLSFNLPQ